MAAGDVPSSLLDQELWCNFCGLKTRDLSEYLAHSCIEELRRRGEWPPPPSGSTACV